MSLVLDTHETLWYLEDSRHLSSTAKNTIEDCIRRALDVFVSSISLVETVYLVEGLRLPYGALQRLRTALTDRESGLVVVPVNLEIAESLRTIPRSQVPDMPDHIIAATGRRLAVPLITRDRRLQTVGIKTIW